MKSSHLFAVFAILILALVGCAGMTGSPARPSAGVERGAWLSASGSPAAGGLLGADADSLDPDEADWLLDSLAVLVDSLLAPADIMAEVPDISDSLAAFTRAQVPSTSELFDYPVEINHRVLSWIDFFLGRGRKNYERGLVRSGRYLAMARRTFQEEGIPQDLVFLAHVESAFKINALSRARALGLWQFMRGTAKLYGLRCDSYVDERLDPEKATRAAARHLRDLHDRYGDWYLALAAYNAGAGNVDRAIQRSGTRDFWQLAQTRYLVNETRNFVPAILAATILAKSPGAYGLTEETEPPLSYDTILVDSPIELRVVARATGTSLADLEQLNPALLIKQTPPLAQKYELHVPLHEGDHAARRLAQIPREERIQQQRHKVRSGENLALIAKRYGTTVRAIQDANRLGRSTLIRAGQTLIVPGRGAAGSAAQEDLFASSGDATTHRVRRGETLSSIAAHHGVSLQALQKANRLVNPNRLMVGQKLAIPGSRPASPPPAPPEEPAAPRAEAASESLGYRVEVLASRTLSAQNNSEALGRVASTAHIVEQARQQIAAAGPIVESPAESPAKTGGAKESSAEPAKTYKVRRGDTLGKIAQRFGVSVAQLRRWNGLRSSHLIYPGQQLAVSSSGGTRGADLTGSASKTSSGRTHVVRRGESAWQIAKRYGVKLDDVLRWNGLSRSSTLRIGQKLVIR